MNIQRLKEKAVRAGELFIESLDHDMLTDGSLSARKSLPVREQLKLIRDDAKKKPSAGVARGAVVALATGTFGWLIGYGVYSTVTRAVDQNIQKHIAAEGSPETARYRSMPGNSPKPSKKTVMREILGDVPRLFKDGASYMLGLPGRREPIKLDRGTTTPARENSQELSK